MKKTIFEKAIALCWLSIWATEYLLLATLAIAANQSDNYEERTDYQIAFFLYGLAPLLFFFAVAGAILFIVRKVLSNKNRNQ